MKFMLIISFLFFMPLLYGQKIYCDTFSTRAISLSLDSDGKFRLSSSSAESMYDPDDLPDLASPRVIWSEGSYSKQGDVILCKDYNGKGTFQLLKQQNGDYLVVTDAFWLKKNNLLKSEEIYDGKKVYSATLLTLLPQYAKLYIGLNVLIDGQLHKLLRVYNWENGKKELIYQRQE